MENNTSNEIKFLSHKFNLTLPVLLAMDKAVIASLISGVRNEYDKFLHTSLIADVAKQLELDTTKSYTIKYMNDAWSLTEQIKGNKNGKPTLKDLRFIDGTYNHIYNNTTYLIVIADDRMTVQHGNVTICSNATFTASAELAILYNKSIISNKLSIEEKNSIGKIENDKFIILIGKESKYYPSISGNVFFARLAINK